MERNKKYVACFKERFIAYWLDMEIYVRVLVQYNSMHRSAKFQTPPNAVDLL